jgi:hypothetical protein
MDLVEGRLRQIDADYEATLAAGKKRESDTHSELVTPEAESDHDSYPEHNTSVKIDCVKYVARDESAPLTVDQVSQIKTHMSSNKLSHNPEWASELSDAQFSRVFLNVFSRDNNS